MECSIAFLADDLAAESGSQMNTYTDDFARVSAHVSQTVDKIQNSSVIETIRV